VVTVNRRSELDQVCLSPDSKAPSALRGPRRARPAEQAPRRRRHLAERDREPVELLNRLIAAVVAVEAQLARLQAADSARRTEWSRAGCDGPRPEVSGETRAERRLAETRLDATARVVG
jgi:hypothetical protein